MVKNVIILNVIIRCLHRDKENIKIMIVLNESVLIRKRNGKWKRRLFYMI